MKADTTALEAMIKELESNSSLGTPTNAEMQVKMANFEQDILGQADMRSLLDMYRTSAYGAASGRHQDRDDLEDTSTRMATAVAYHLMNHKLRNQINVNYRALKDSVERQFLTEIVADSLAVEEEVEALAQQRGRYLDAMEAAGGKQAYTDLASDFNLAETEIAAQADAGLSA